MSNKAEIVFSQVLDGSGGSSDPGAEQDAANPVWVHLDISSRKARSFLLKQGLETYVVDTLTRQESRPHTVVACEGVVVVLRGINRNAGADPEDMVSIRIWFDTERMFSIRQRPVRAAQAVSDQLKAGAGPRSIPDLLIAIIATLADGIAEFIDDIEERMEAFEQAVEAGASCEFRGEISAMRRQVAAVRRYLAPQRDALESLSRIAGKWLDKEQQFSLMEQSDRMTRYVEDLDLVRERAQVVQEELMNRIAQEQNSRTYLFSIVATIFLPITFISGMFGMNTAGLPGLEDGSAFWIVAAAMGVISFGIVIWLRAKHWF